MKNRIGILSFLLTILLVASSFFHPAYSTSAGLLPNAVQQFFDNNGNPLSSGTVTTYETGTSTLKTTWRDSTGVTANTNPIVLDAGGKAIIYGEGTYRQLVKDRNGNTVWDAVTSPDGGATPTQVGDGNLVGTVLPWSGLVAPNQYVFAYGQAISRATFADFFTAVTQSLNVICTSGSNTLTGLSDTTQIKVGSALEASLCVVAGTTVTSKTGSTVVMSNTSSVSINSTARFFPYGNGNGTSTFNVPDLRGYAVAGRDNMGGTAASRLTSTYFATAGLGATGGSQSQEITFSQGLYTAGAVAADNDTSITFGVVQPTITLNYVVKVTSDISTSIATGVASINGMTGVITCGTGLLCTGNVIQVAGISQSTLVSVDTGWGLTGGPCTVTCTVAVSTTAPALGYGLPVNLQLDRSVGSNALTLSVKTGANGGQPSATNPVLFPFRDNTNNDGALNWVAAISPLTLTIISGATLGVNVPQQPFRFWLAVFNDNGTLRLCAINTLSVTGATSTISSFSILSLSNNGNASAVTPVGSTAQTWYCDASVTSRAYTLVGYIAYNSGLATNGLYVSNPNIMQLYGPGVALPGQVVGTSTDNTATTQSTTNASYTLLGTSLRANYTRQAASNVLKITTVGTAQASTTAGVGIQIARNSTLLGFGVEPNTNAAGGTAWPITNIAYDGPQTVSANSYQIFGKASAGTVTYPASSTGAIISVEEIQR